MIIYVGRRVPLHFSLCRNVLKMKEEGKNESARISQADLPQL
jgi:hypothetical protein